LNHDELLQLAHDAVKDTGRLVRSLSQEQRGVESTEVGGREVKLYVDKLAHNHLSSLLAVSGLPILSEEDRTSHEMPLDALWVIDPLDGSYNFTRGLGHSMISCAFVKNGEPLFGVLFDVVNEAVYLGGVDHPSQMNGSPIHCSEASSLGSSVLCTGFPVRFNNVGESEKNSYLSFMRGFARVRMLGSAAHSICLVARGAADCYAEQSIMFWDVAAGIAVARGAGVKLLNPTQFTLRPLSVVLAPSSLANAIRDCHELSWCR